MAKPTPVYVGCKPCAECTRVKLMSDFDRRGCGYSKTCKSCAGTVVPPGHKRCTRCKEVKPFSEFNEHGVRRGRRELKSGCRECLTGAARTRYAEDAEYRAVLAERKSQRYQSKSAEINAAAKAARDARTPEQVERDRQKARDRYTADREKVYAQNARWRAANPERHRANARAWAARHRQANPDQVREVGRRAASRRRAVERGLPSEPYTLAELIERDGPFCVLCGDELDASVAYPDPWSPTVEHLECLSWPDSPGDVLTNVAVAHFTCNTSRRTNIHPAATRKRAELLAAERAAESA